MFETFEIEISYGQIAVFLHSLSQPFNDWTDRHVSQGFTWRPGSVSFRTLYENGLHSIVVSVLSRAPNIRNSIIRAIQVPFVISEGAEVEISSIDTARRVSIPYGIYSLRCEFTEKTDTLNPHIYISFIQADSPSFSIIKADPTISTDVPLLTMATPGV